MDFMKGLPRSNRQHDSIWVIVNRMTKSSHFLPIKTTYSAEDYVKLYLQEVVRQHGVPDFIISNRGSQFTAESWKSFKKGLGSKVNLSITYPQTDGQAERSIQTLEDILGSYVIDFKGIGMITYLTLLSSLTTTVTIRAFKWLHIKLFIGEDTDLLCSRLVNKG